MRLTVRDTFSTVWFMQFNSHREIINQWGGSSAYGSLATDLRLSSNTVKQWRARNSIPPAYFFEVIQAAERRGIKGVTHEILQALMMAKRKRVAVAA